MIIDVQNDFLPGGALAVPHGDEVVDAVNTLIPQYDVVVATQNWHPPNHQSFAAEHPQHGVGDVVRLGDLEQMLWPTHCGQGEHGADLAAGLNQTGIDHVVRKGVGPSIDSYARSSITPAGSRRDLPRTYAIAALTKFTLPV